MLPSPYLLLRRPFSRLFGGIVAVPIFLYAQKRGSSDGFVSFDAVWIAGVTSKSKARWQVREPHLPSLNISPQERILPRLRLDLGLSDSIISK